ncbi:uncharacterized protein LOC105844441 isoform X5 [Hydra vulgaris]
MNNGLDRCASLLNALLSSPKVSHQANVPQKKSRKKVLPDVELAVKTTTAKPLFNKRLVSSTPAFSNVSQVIASEFSDTQPKQQGIYNDVIKATMHPINENIGASTQKTLFEDSNTSKENASLNLLLKSITEKLSLNEDKNLLITSASHQVHNDHIISGKNLELKKNVCQAKKLNFKTVNTKERNDIDLEEKNPNVVTQSKYGSNDKQLENNVVNFQQETKSDIINLSTSLKSVIELDSVEKKNKKNISSLFIPSQLSVYLNPSEESNTQLSVYLKPSEGSNTKLPVYLNPSDPSSTQLTTLKYLLKELRDMINIKACGFELNQLFEEIDHIVELLPFSMANSAVNECNNDLVLLKIENADLKQNLRYFHQELEMLKLSEKMINQKDNDELRQKILVEEENNFKLSNQVQEVIMVAEELRKENEDLWKHISIKDTQFNENLNAWQIERCKLLEEHAEKQRVIEEYESRCKSSEKSITILQVSINQRDTEINRLNKLTRDLQQSVTNLLLDINRERNKKIINREPNKNVFTHQLVKKSIPVNALNLPRREFHLNESSINPEPKFNSINSDLNSLSSLNDATDSSTFSCAIGSVGHETDSCISTLKTSDSSEFQKDLKNLDEEILKIQQSLTKVNN